MCATSVLLMEEAHAAFADPVIAALDEGALEAGEDSPYRRSERGVWMRYDYQERGWQKWCRFAIAISLGNPG